MTIYATLKKLTLLQQDIWHPGLKEIVKVNW